MKLKHLLAVAMAVSVAFASCSKEDNIKGDGNKETVDSKEMFIQIGQAKTTPESRAIGQPSGPVDVVFETGTIIFTTEDGIIRKVVDIVTSGASPVDGKVTVAQLKAGTRVGLMKADVKKCYLYANLTDNITTTTITVGANISDFQMQMWHLKDNLNGVALKSIPLYGDGPVTEAQVTIDGTLTDVLKSSFEVYPVTARIQLAKLLGNETIKSFKVAGIYINNYFIEMNAGLKLNKGNIFYNGIVPGNYALNTTTGSYSKPGHDIMLNEGAFNKVDDKTYTASATDKDVWGYNVLPNYKLTRKELPHIVIKLTDVIVLEGTDEVSYGTQFLTVRGYKDASGSISVLEGGKSYTLAELKFDKSNLGERPEAADELEGFVEITVNGWTDKPVTGEWL